MSMPAGKAGSNTALNKTIDRADVSPVHAHDSITMSGPSTSVHAPTTAAPGIAAPAVIPESASAGATHDVTANDTPDIQQLWAAAKGNAHPEIWGVTLADPDRHVPSQIVLQKYLNANDGDVSKATEQLIKTLDWRAKTNPPNLCTQKFSKDKYAGLGYVTTYGDATEKGPDGKEVFTWNIYGGVSDIQKTFGDLEDFINWRVTLMELAMKELDLAQATIPITATYDPYKVFQVHDYKSISFFRSPPVVRTASKKTIEVLSMAYPETLKEKFFVNVPAFMGFMYGVMKLFVAAKTIQKFHPMSNGGALALEFKESKVKSLATQLPKEYGGSGPELANSGKEPLTE